MTRITQEDLNFFNENGYLAVSDVLDPAGIIDPIIEEYASVLDRLASELYAAGAISSTYSDLPFSERVTRVYQESGEVHNQYFDFSLPLNDIKPDTPFWAGPAVFKAFTASSLLDAVECFIGPEVYSNPVQHVRIKVPEDRAPLDDDGNVKQGATPWHQDNGVVTEDADGTDMLTVWFPLMDASAENGCLRVVPGSHKEGLVTHCPGYKGMAGVQIPEKIVDTQEAVVLPIKKGGALFLHKKTIHSSLPNVSNRIRWSFDLRYQPTGQPTGRSVFPGFVARSRSNPMSELRDAGLWRDMWRTAREELALSEQPRFNRWNTEDVMCA